MRLLTSLFGGRKTGEGEEKQAEYAYASAPGSIKVVPVKPGAGMVDEVEASALSDVEMGQAAEAPGRVMDTDAGEATPRNGAQRRTNRRAGSEGVAPEHAKHKRRSSILVPEAERVKQMRRATLMGAPPSAFDEMVKGSWRGNIIEFLDHNATQVVLIFALFFALFAADSFAAAHASDDDQKALEWTLVVVLLIFLTEFVLNCLSRADYILSFFFFMDVLGTLSIVADIPMIMAFFGFDLEQGTVLRASRAARVGSRAGRMTKLVRLLRVVRVVRLYKILQQRQSKAQEKKEEGAKSEYAASAIAERLSESISKQVAALSMLCIMAAPLLAYENLNNIVLMYQPTISSYEGQLYSPALATTMDEMIRYTDSVYERPITTFVDLDIAQNFSAACPPDSLTGRGEVKRAYVRMANYDAETPELAAEGAPTRESCDEGGRCAIRCYYTWRSNNLNPSRKKDRVTMGPICREMAVAKGRATYTELSEAEAKASTKNVFCTYLQVDVSKKNEEGALYNVGLILFAIFVLLTFSTLLNSTCTRMVLEPLERMFNLLQTNAKQLFEALDATAKDSDKADDDDDDDEPDDLTTMESILNKMTKLIKHVSAGEQGQHMMDEIMENEDIDQDAKSYLQSVTAGTARRSTGGDGLEKSMRTARQSKIEMSRPGSADAIVFKARIDDKLIDSWKFDVFEVEDKEHLFSFIARMFSNLDLLDSNCIPRPELHKFLQGVADLMAYERTDPPPPAYHNFLHVCDVTHGVYRYIQLTDPIVRYTTIERMSLMVAALAHDLGHPGINNAFLVNTRDSLATTYNDISVLENSHAAKMYEMIAGDEEKNIFRNLPDSKTWFEIRKLIIDMILHTDMTGHFSMVSKLQVFLELHGDTPKSEENYPDALFIKPEDRSMILGLILHAADVSNPTKHWEYFQKWTHRVCQEFFEQGDRERAAGLPISPGNDRDTVSIPQSQVNFMEFVIAPLVSCVVRLFPMMRPLGITFGENRDKWQDLYFEELDASDKTDEEKEEAKAAMNSRKEKFWANYGAHFKPEETQSRNRWKRALAAKDLK